MGCMGSKPATPEECDVICDHMGKAMLKMCIDPTLDQADSIKVRLPKDFDQVKSAVEELRNMASRATADGQEQDGDGQEKTEARKGIMSSMVTMASEAASKAHSSVKGMAAAGASAGLNAAASSLEKAISAFEEPMAKIAQDVIVAKRPEIVTILKAHIKETKFSDAPALCKGPANALSEDMIVKGAPVMGKQFVNSVDEFLTQSAAVKAWDTMIGSYNDAVNLGKQAVGDKFPLKGIQLDIKQYIQEEIFAEIGKAMGQKEAEVRANPANRPVGCPAVFVAVLRGASLTAADYKAVMKEMPTAV